MKYLNKTVLLCILILLGFHIYCAYYNTFYNAKKYYNTAYQEIIKINQTELSAKAINNLEMSAEKSLKLLELYPNSKYADDARLLLGKCYYYQKQYFQAREYLHQLIHYQPNSELLPQANLWLIKTDIADKKYDNAELQINELLKKKLPNNIKAEIFLLQANLYRRNKNHEQAVDYYNKCTEVNKKLRPEAYFAIGMIYDSLNNYQQSALYYKKVIKLNPDQPYDFESRLKYGIALKKQNEIDLALKNFYELLRKELEERQKAEINLQIADCLMRQGNIETAILEYGDIIKNFPKTAEAAIAYFKLGKFFEERMKYKRALQNYLQVKSEHSQSKYIDSSQTRQQALFRLLALREMISVGLQDSSESREISNKIIFSEQNISNFRDDTTTVSLVEHDSVETVETDENVDEAAAKDENDDNNQQNETDNNTLFSENQSFQDRENLNDKEESKPKEVINPEISKLDVKKLDKNLFLLGEIFMLSFNHPDSALANYKFIIDNLPESEYVPKAYFNSAYIYDTIKNNHPKADSLYNVIVNKFPDTETARRARIKLSIAVLESEENQIINLYKKAEDFMLEKNEPLKACNIYSNIIKKYPHSDLLPKIYYSLGWCYENKLDSLHTAYVIYDSLLNKYPESQYARQIKQKVQQVKDFEKKQAETIKPEGAVTTDSTQQESENELSQIPSDTSRQDTIEQLLRDQELIIEKEKGEEKTETQEKILPDN